MEVCKVCPRLITMNQDLTSYTGYIDTSQGRQFKVQIDLKSRSSLKGARVRCEWALHSLLKGYSHILQQRLNQASSLATFLEDLKSIVERRLDETPEPEAASSRLCGEVLQQLEALGWDRLSSVDPSFQRFELKAVDGGRRTHILRVQLHAQHPERPPTCQVDLPKHFNFQWSQQRQLEGMYEQFEQSLAGFQDFWDEMGRIDGTTWVLEPEKPTHSATHRRIVLSASVSLQLSVDPTNPRLLPECRFLGSDQAVQPFQDNFNKNLQYWDEGASLVDNLQRVLEHEFPSPSNTRKEDFSVECGICYAYRLDTEIPDKTCDDSRCGQPFHSSCLYEWLRGLPSSRQSFNTVFGECPYCSKTITVKMLSTS